MNPKRIHNFDFLRGLFVILALGQHFTAYLSGWYVWHADTLGSAPITSFHQQFADTRIPTDGLGIFMAWFFSPWVSHIYLAMAAFNLAKRSREDFKHVYKTKLIAFAALFVLFFVENAFIASSIGGMFSFYPLMAWMVVLFALTMLYRFCGVVSIVFVWLFAVFQSVLGIDPIFDQLENSLRLHFHSAFEYDARIHYYLASGALGFLLGYLHFQRSYFERAKKALLVIGGGAALTSVWLAFGEAFKVDPSDVLHYEHMFDRSLTGTLFIQGVQILVLSAFLIAELHKYRIPKNVLHWIGIHSLLVFAFHRLFFLKLIGPTRELLGGFFGVPMTNYNLEAFAYAFLSAGFSYLLIRSPIPALIFDQGKWTSTEDKKKRET